MKNKFINHILNIMVFVVSTFTECLMKRLLLLAALTYGLLFSPAIAGGGDLNDDDEIQRRSELFEPNPFLFNTSYPLQFNQLNNPVTQAAVSTGYYFVDSKDEALDYWRPIPDIYDLANEEDGPWKRIVSGPRQVDPSWWRNPANRDGLYFFRNPAYPSDGSSFFVNPTDSTDDAFAGPIPLRMAFFFNGIQYDSFYVSTNGLIALTNRRYIYDDDGNRYIPPGNTHCYNIYSDDWFVTSYNRQRRGDGLADPTPDDYGYYYVVCGGNPSSPTAGIRDRNTGNGSLNTISSPHYAAIIAPLWGDNQLSQYNAEGMNVDDFGQVWFKRIGEEKLVIYVKNMQPARTKAIPTNPFSYNAAFDIRPGQQNFVSASFQVILNRLDSSITIVYETFQGRAYGSEASVIFRYNNTVGVRGFARHVNYGQGGCAGSQFLPWCGWYEQFTHYFAKLRVINKDYPEDYLAIKFKQWKNTLRVVDISYRVRKEDPEAGPDFTEEVPTTKVADYEILAGERQIGAIQPVAIIQNLSNEIQGPAGVNFQRQQLNFRARFKIVNEATGRIVYNRLVPVDSICLALPDSLTRECTGDPNVKVRYVSVAITQGNVKATELPFPGTARLRGIPPYGFVQVFFPPFEPNEFLANHIGRLRAYVIADPTDPSTSLGFGDEWPFDDTTNVRIFSLRRLDEFSDDVTRFHRVGRTPMPSTLKWVNIEAEVAQGDEVSHHPLPPRGGYRASNNEDFSIPIDIVDLRGTPMQSPVILMNRVTLDNLEPPKSPGGDELRSFPINLLNRRNAVLSLSFQRSTKQDSWDRGWSDATIIGCEPRTFVNGELLSIFGDFFPPNLNNTYTYSVANDPDQIVVELMQPSPDGVRFITNVPEARWRNHPRRGGLKPITDVPAYALYGSNGYFVGFLETDKDSSLEKENRTDYLRNGLRPDPFDDGIDFEFRKAFIPIPDTFIFAPAQGAKNFRFRIRVLAYNHKKCLQCIPDDKDPFYVDNVRILFPTEITDVEMASVKIRWPYTVVPASQATAIPIIVKMSNNTSIPAPSYWVKVRIHRQRGDGIYPPLEAIYCRTKMIPSLSPRDEKEESMPSWNARPAGPGQYRMIANVIVPGGDLEPLNDTTYTDIRLEFGNVFAYDPPQLAINDVPTFLPATPGRGLNLYGYSQGGTGSIYGGSIASYNNDFFAAGYVGGSASGQIAVKFKLFQPDTIYGYQAFFGTSNQAMDDIALSIYDDQADNQPGNMRAGSLIYRFRGVDDSRGGEIFWDQYVTYLLPQPLVLQAGTYWAVIAQLGQTGLELGASKWNMGMRTTNVSIPPPVTTTGPVGANGVHLMIEKNFRKKAPQGQALINNNLFAYENTRGSGTWNQFMPTVGNPAYAHLHHYGISPMDGLTATLSRGGWIPMIRPYLGPRPWGKTVMPDPCDDDIPVELLSFEGFARNGGVELIWETATEINNLGFYIERKNSGESDDEWKSIGFVEGAGNSKMIRSYSYFDGEVKLNTTYDYRLRQVDLDGTQSCYVSDIVTVHFDKVGVLTLDQNVPNPFSYSTQIGFNLPQKLHVKLEVIDIYGNIVKILWSGELEAQRHQFYWDGTDQNGNQVASGTYIYRLTAGSEVVSGRMTLIR